jgi:hypothetical protein
MGEHGNEYDHNPPEPPAPVSRKKPGPPDAKTKACMDWLAEQLTPNPVRVSALRKSAAAAGVITSESSAATLYRAKDALGVEEFPLDGNKWWRLPDGGDVQDNSDTNSDTWT